MLIFHAQYLVSLYELLIVLTKYSCSLYWSFYFSVRHPLLTVSKIEKIHSLEDLYLKFLCFELYVGTRDFFLKTSYNIAPFWDFWWHFRSTRYGFKNLFQCNKITLKICFRFKAIAFPLISSKYVRLSVWGNPDAAWIFLKLNT